MDNSQPLISIVIPAYNHEKYIGATLSSALNQTVTDTEVIVINDGSTDGTEEAVKRFGDDRIRYFYQENRGAHETINRGISMARGKYISVLNSDDIYEAPRLEKALALLEDSDKKADAVFTHVELVDENGHHIRYQEDPTDEGDSAPPLLLRLLSGNFLLTTSNLIADKTVFEHMVPFRNLKYTHDYDFFLRLASRFHAVVIREPLLKYRVHPENTLNMYKSAQIDFEIGVVLADFFLTHDLVQWFPEKNLYDRMTRFFNLINPYRADRVIFVLVLLSQKDTQGKPDFFETLMNDPDNPFRKVCIDFLGKRADWWWKEQAENYKKTATDLQKGIEYYKRQATAWHKSANELKTGNEYLEKQRLAWEKSATSLKESLEKSHDEIKALEKETEELRMRIEELKSAKFLLKIGKFIMASSRDRVDEILNPDGRT